MRHKKLSTPITIRISKTLERALIKVAAANERSVAFMIRSILAKELSIPSDQTKYDLVDKEDNLTINNLNN